MALSSALADLVRATTRPRPAPLCPELRLHLADALLPVWEASEAVLATGPLPPPYWAYCWPGSAALARLLLDHPERARDRRVLDFGAGCGIAAIAAARTGAREVLAADVDPVACAATHLNADLNGARVATTQDDLLGQEVAADLVLAGDVCYQRELAARVARWLEACAASGAEVLLADPGRGFLPTGHLEPIATYTVPVLREVEDVDARSARVYRLTALTGPSSSARSRGG